MQQINKIVIVSPMYKQIESIIKKRPVCEEKEFRFLSEQEVTQEDYRWADAFVSFKRPQNFSFENMKWVHSFGAGVDKIMKGIEWKEDVLLTRTICSFGQKISEYCMSYILRDLQQHGTYDRLQKEQIWKEIAPVPLHEKKVVIYGTGVIGQEVARSLAFFGVDVYGISLSGKKKEFFKEVYSSEGDHFAALAEADYIINTMPLTAKTEKLFNETLFHQLKNAFFINVGRGESVENGDLLRALETGNVRMAVLDVFQEEPLPMESHFWHHPKLVITPHISALTTPEEGVDCFLDTLHNVENDQELYNVVDLQKGF